MLEELVTGELFSAYPHNKSRKKRKKNNSGTSTVNSDVNVSLRASSEYLVGVW